MTQEQVIMKELKGLEMQLRDILPPVGIVPQHSQPFRIEGSITCPDDLAKHCAKTAIYYQAYVSTIGLDGVSDSQLARKKMELQERLQECKGAVQSFKRQGDRYVRFPETRSQTHPHGGEVRKTLLAFLGGLNNFSDFFDQLMEWLSAIESWISGNDFQGEDLDELKAWLQNELDAFEAYSG